MEKPLTPSELIAWYVRHVVESEGTHFLLSHTGKQVWVSLAESEEALAVLKMAVEGGYQADERELEAIENGTWETYSGKTLLRA